MLDPALIRPGRVDRIVSLKLASLDQIITLFLRFHPGKESVARLYARSIPTYELSMAQVQSHLLRFRGSPLEAVSNIPKYLAEIRANQKRRDDYEASLKAPKSSKKKEKDHQVDESSDEDVEIEMPKIPKNGLDGALEKVKVNSDVSDVDSATISKSELSHSVHGLDNSSLTEDAAVVGVRNRKKNKSKQKQAGSSLSMTK